MGLGTGLDLGLGLGLGLGFDHTVADGVANQIVAVGDVEFLQEVTAMGIDGRLRDKEPFGNLPGGEAFCDEDEDIFFSGGEFDGFGLFFSRTGHRVHHL